MKHNPRRHYEFSFLILSSAAHDYRGQERRINQRRQEQNRPPPSSATKMARDNNAARESSLVHQPLPNEIGGFEGPGPVV